ncbi:MAG: sigma 54-interacting transcriptional regulator [Proteobacteria bacterium]|nr:sigma 54-interacting transcriptional regulator [Pseudomonadota bacterium]
MDLPLGCDVSIGRSRSSAIQLDNPGVSRLHATLRCEPDGRIRLTDHGSRNGTFADGRRVQGSVPLCSGAEVTVGGVRMLVVVQRSPEDERGSNDAPDKLLLVARDPAMLRSVALAERAAKSNATVLVVGETGVGKEMFGQRIHAMSARTSGPFIAVNCGSIPETLAESILFGHEKGAFTGATARNVGVFEAASGGDLFLDEVGELSLPMQARLLRVLEERVITRVGSTKAVAVDVRVIAATNRDLHTQVQAGTFREDLYYRLDVLRIAVPPLRERPEDVEPLVRSFVVSTGETVEIADDAMAVLHAHTWPGNVRELRNVIDRAVALRNGDVLRAEDFPSLRAPTKSGPGTLRHKVGDAEREAIAEALRANNGNQSRAARRLGISRRALIYKLEKYGLKSVKKREAP